MQYCIVISKIIKQMKITISNNKNDLDLLVKANKRFLFKKFKNLNLDDIHIIKTLIKLVYQAGKDGEECIWEDDNIDYLDGNNKINIKNCDDFYS
jgi:hypothetical protein